ncbi:MAG: single-stranded DNA-binding protein [Treponema sp.]|nr:single-stranded DNA-binding protein [Treponema sp.]
MNQLNCLIVEGNIAKDPETLKTANGSDVSKFPIAINRFYKDKDGNTQKEVVYFEIEAWDNLSKLLNKENWKKGDEIRIVGRMKQNQWKDSTGKSHSSVSIIAEHINLIKPARTVKKAPKSKDDDYGMGR